MAKTQAARKSSIVELELNRAVPENIIFKIHSVVYQNEDSGYTVAELTPENAKLGLKGGQIYSVLATFTHGNLLRAKMYIQVKGALKEHPKYGYQLEAKNFSLVLPDQEQALLQVAMAVMSDEMQEDEVIRLDRRLYSQCNTSLAACLKAVKVPSSVLSALNEDDKDRLQSIRGRLYAVKYHSAVMDELLNLGFPMQYMNIAIELFLNELIASGKLKVDHASTADTSHMILTLMRERPYCLMANDTIPFRVIDGLARRLGVRGDEGQRIRHHALNTLMQAEQQSGHLYLPVSDLARQTAYSLQTPVSVSAIRDELSAMKADNIIAHLGSNWVGRAFSYRAEQAVVEFIDLAQRHQQRKGPPPAVGALSSYYNAHQQQAIRNALTQPISVLTGGPGTGKSTTIKGIVETALSLGWRQEEIVLMAPTGKAARRMSQVAEQQASTIHSGIGASENHAHALMPSSTFDQSVIKRGRMKCLVIVDEVSMLDTHLAGLLCHGLHPESHLVLVGDVDQLPSVGAGRVLHDLIDAGVVACTELQSVYRFGLNTDINDISARVRLGDQVDLEEFDDDTSEVYFEAAEEKDILNTMKQHISRMLENGVRASEIQVITPMRQAHNALSTVNLNKALRELLNSKHDIDPYPLGQYVVSVGDRIMLTKNMKAQAMPKHIVKDRTQLLTSLNNYKRRGASGLVLGKADKPLYNGDIGQIVAIEGDGKTRMRSVLISVDQGLYLLRGQQMILNMELGYAMTIHKSQGSEYPYVLMPLSTSHRVMQQRSLFYTGITRAREGVYMTGNSQCFQDAIDNNPQVQRNTALKGLLQQDPVFDRKPAIVPAERPSAPAQSYAPAATMSVH